MKKALSLLLAVAMLGTMCTVPAWAEDETIDIPAIEEIAEEELELFGEEVELSDSVIGSIETSETDGITLFTELSGYTVTAQKNGNGGHEGSIASLYNGQITVGDNLGGSFVTNGTIREGFMIFKGDSITIDFGEKKTFSGIRLWDSSRSRYFSTYGTDGTGNNPRPGARRIKTSMVYFSEDGINWYKTFPATAIYNEEGLYSDILFPMNGKGAKININTRYLRFEATSVTDGWGELEMEEIAMIDANGSLKTWSLDGYELPSSVIESVTAGSEWNTQSYAIKNAYDGMLSLSSYWHSIANASGHTYTDEDRSFTIVFKEKTNVGGVRLWPRNDATATANAANTASMRKVRLMGSENGTDWYNITAVTSDLHSEYNANGYMMPVDVLIPASVDSNVKYLKVVGEKVDNYVCLAEFQVLSADIKGEASAYLFDEDVVSWKTTPSVTKVVSSLGKSVATQKGMFDGIIYQTMNTGEGYHNVYKGKGSIEPHWEIDNALTDGGYVTVDFDLGREYTFSAARLFGRWNQGYQNFKEGYICVSDDGENWYSSDLYTDTYTVVNSPAPGMRGNDDVEIVNNPQVNMAKYASTGDVYTDITLKFGEEKNITARYMRIYVTKTGGAHWSWQELVLVAPDNANETLTVASLATRIETDAAAVEEKINALGSAPADSAISDARKAYDKLPEAAKALIDAEVYAKLTAAEQLVAGKVFEFTVAENTGVREAVFTLPVRSNMTIKSVKYVDTLGNTKDGTAATTVTSDGSLMTIKIAGEYTDATGLTNYSNGSKGTYYFAESNATYGWTKGQEIKGYFKGYFVRLVASDGIGDHFIEITFGDDTKETVNIKTTPVWTTLSSAAAIEGSDYTDEIAPKATWKVTTTAMGVSMAAAFDGKAEYLLRKAGSNSSNRYESDYTPGKYTDTPDGAAIANQVLLYKPVRTDFIIDTGEATKTSGIRIYPRIGTFNEDKTKGTSTGAPTQVRYWGSADGEEWEVIGDFDFNTTCGEKTAIFSENVEYRYYKASIIKVNHTEHKATVNISELTFLKPNTIISSDESVTIDVADNAGAEFEFALAGTEAPASLKDAENKDVAYTWANGTLTISADTVATLANGENVLTLTFSNGATFEISINKIDTTKKSYVISVGNNAGTSELVLENSAKKDVKKITLDGVEMIDRVYNASITVPKYTLSEDKSEITIPRYSMRGTTDIYAKLSLAENASCDVPLVVTYEDDTTKTYTVTFTASWAALPEVTGTFAEDEITPVTGSWKVRTSSNNSDTGHPVNAFAKELKNRKDYQNWHTAYIAISGAAITDSNLGQYVDVDFGADAPTYRGVRITERVQGSRYSKIVIYGKNADSEAWTELFNGPALAVAPETNTIEFAAPVSYRYLRFDFDQAGHITTDTIHILKDMVYLTGEDKVTLEKGNLKDATFTFHMPEDAEGVATVKYNETAVDAANYTFENGVLTLKKAYLESLGNEDSGVLNFDITVDGVNAKVSVEIKDLYNVDYYITDEETARGTDELILTVPEGKTVKAVKYGEADVTYTAEDGEIIVKRYDFRSLDDLWNLDKITLNVTFEGETNAIYNVTLVNYSFAVTGVAEASFAEDEIVPGENWSVMASSIHMAGNGIVGAFAKTGTYWHTAYTEGKNEGGDTIAIPDTKESRQYLKVTVGTDSEAAEIYGLRYYARTDNLAGTWAGVAVYAKAKAADEWTLVKTQNFDNVNLSETRIANIYFDEAVKASEVLLVIDSGNFAYATAKAITFLNETAKTPDAEEGEIEINVTPTTGGNVYVNGAPSLGNSYVEANKEVTLTADEAGFKYWLDANTGKILGDTTTLNITIASARDIKAVFADPISTEAFVSFLGRNAKSVISSGYVRKGEAATLPSAKQLYQTGYTFSKWVDKNGADIDATAAITADTDFYAVYVEDESVASTICVSGGTIALADGTDEAAAEKTYGYNTKVMAVANDAPEGQKFAYWTLNGNIVCYTKTYIFFTPDLAVNLEAVFADKDETVEKAVNITLNATATSVDSTNVLSVLTTRVIPADVEVIETGIIYVKDNEAGELTIDRVGETTASGKKIKVSLSDSKVSGQYKLSASYNESGITARGFVTYKSGDEIITVYTVNYVF